MRGIAAVKFAVMKPRIPNDGIKIRARIIPIVNDMVVSLRVRLVFPWLFIRFAVLRDPRAVNR